MLISIVTPTLNEELTLPNRASELAVQTQPWEWIVADGGSPDATVNVATSVGANVAAAPRGRGLQLNAGAAIAQGDVLLFLHADTVLPPGSLDAIRAALADPKLIGGNFHLRFEGQDWVSQVLTLLNRAQRRLFNVYYGDSAIFVRREVFELLGGFRDYPVMEDYDFVQRMKRLGKTTCLTPTVTTSARRYRGRIVKAATIWGLIFLLYNLGVPPARLVRLYAAPGEGGDLAAPDR